MPLYTYYCSICEVEFDRVRRMDRTTEPCECGSLAVRHEVYLQNAHVLGDIFQEGQKHNRNVKVKQGTEESREAQVEREHFERKVYKDKGMSEDRVLTELRSSMKEDKEGRRFINTKHMNSLD